MANPIYSRQFNFIEVNVPSREALIVDGDSDEENDCEQSDMVQVLLNIAFAPKSVVKDFVFGPGISLTFKYKLEDNKLVDWSSDSLHSEATEESAEEEDGEEENETSSMKTDSSMSSKSKSSKSDSDSDK